MKKVGGREKGNTRLPVGREMGVVVVQEVVLWVGQCDPMAFFRQLIGVKDDPVVHQDGVTFVRIPESVVAVGAVPADLDVFSPVTHFPA